MPVCGCEPAALGTSSQEEEETDEEDGGGDAEVPEDDTGGARDNDDDHRPQGFRRDDATQQDAATPTGGTKRGDTKNAGVREPTRPGKAPAPGETLSPADAKLLRALTEASLEHLPLFTQVSERVLALDAEMAGWLSAPASGGSSAMLAAAGRERLHRSAGGYTHVLVESDALAADVVTRKSLAGSSGRLTHLGSASVSWLLVETAHGSTVGGGQSSSAGRLVLDVASGKTAGSSIDLQSHELPRDPYANFELAVKAFLVMGALALVIFSVAAMINLLWGD